MKLKKRGQITLFLIAGVLLLLAFGIYLYTQRAKFIRPIEEQRSIVAEVPLELQPINSYITNCIYETAKDGIIKLGDHGGYIEHSNLIFNPVEPTSEEAVKFSPKSELIIPYWWHMSDKNKCQGTCEFSSKRPPLYKEQGEDSIENQLDEYVNKKLKDCISNFKPFTEQGFNFQDSTINAKTSIAKDDVFLLVNYPVSITKDGKNFEIDEYAIEIPLNLREIYFLATNITNIEAQHSFIEKDIRQIIDAFSKLDTDALPPVSELIIGFGSGTFWIKNSVVEKLKQLLSSYIPLIQVSGTRNYHFIESPANIRDRGLYEVVYNRGMIIPLNEDHSSLAVKFTYLPIWEPYFDLNCRGQLCQPESVGSTFGFLFGFQRYSFAYDISIPVLVEISNPEAFGGEGYSFKFFLEANMRNNEPMPADFSPLESIARPAASLLCDQDKRSPNNTTVRIIDGRAKQQVNGAQITFACGSESCPIGTALNSSLASQFPKCLGGIVGVEKSDYHSGFAQLDTDLEQDQQISITLEPYRLVDFKVKKYLLQKTPVVLQTGSAEVPTKTAWRWQVDTSSLQSQESDEDTLVIMKRIGNNFEKEFTAIADICGGEAKSEVPCGDPPQDVSQGIRLIPGLYKANIYSFKYPQQPVIIPPHRKCERYGTFNEKKECYYVPKEPIIFNATNPLPVGMAEFEFEVTQDF